MHSRPSIEHRTIDPCVVCELSRGCRPLSLASHPFHAPSPWPRSLFLCVTVGEFNAGKSALLNALLGTRACVEGVLPTTSTINLLKHASTAFDAHRAAVGASASGRSPPPRVLDVPVEWLRGVTLVDTPGTNSVR